MAVKIRLARRGRAKKPFYHIVVADARAPRDGKFIEKIGVYNPLTSPATIELDNDRAFDWLMMGAIPTETMRSILRFKGVLYKKHLQGGVKKGALTQEQADNKYQEFIQSKEAKIQKRFEEVRKEKDALRRKLAGVDMPMNVASVEVKEEEQINRGCYLGAVTGTEIYIYFKEYLIKPMLFYQVFYNLIEDNHY